MPELPEVETVRRGLAPVMSGATIVSMQANRPDLRFPLPERFSDRLVGQTVRSVDRRAKYLVAPLSSGEALIMHLGMTGRFLIERPDRGLFEPGAFYDDSSRHAAHDHVVFGLSDGTRIIYNDPRRFGFMDLVPESQLAASQHFKGMGLEPLSKAFTSAAVAKLFCGKKQPLKAALLDQRLIAGLGNIYVCEALHRSGLSPLRKAETLIDAKGRPKASVHHLVANIRMVLQEAIAAGGSTLRDYAGPDGTAGRFQHRFRVYDHAGQPCATPECRGTIQRMVQAGRSTYYCPSCQR